MSLSHFMLCYERKTLLINVLVGKGAWNENDVGIQGLRFKYCVSKTAGTLWSSLGFTLHRVELILWRRVDGDPACTSKAHQWHVHRGAKIDPQPRMQLNFLNLGWERNQQEVHHSCLYDSRSLEKGLAGRKANKYFKSLKIKKLYKRGLTWHFVC